MIRAAELSLFLSPIIAYLLWRRFSTVPPTRATLFAMLAALVVIGTGLVWSGLQERHPEGSHYVPAEMRDGQVTPGRGV